MGTAHVLGTEATPITDLGVTAQGYAQLMERAVETAADCCDGKVVASLAGGYGIEGGLPYTNLAVIATLAGFDTSHIREPSTYAPPAPDHRPDVTDVIAAVRDTQAQYWEL